MKNYFTIHKNKKPKRLFQKRFNPFTGLFLITAAMGDLQLSTIQSQPTPKYRVLDLGVDERFNSFNHKVKQMGESVLDTSIAILRLTRQQQLYKFKTTRCYGRSKVLKTIREYERLYN